MFAAQHLHRDILKTNGALVPSKHTVWLVLHKHFVLRGGIIVLHLFCHHNFCHNKKTAAAIATFEWLQLNILLNRSIDLPHTHTGTRVYWNFI